MREDPATVFVVDDDEAVRASLKLLLKTLGLPAKPSHPPRSSSRPSMRAEVGVWCSTSGCLA